MNRESSSFDYVVVGAGPAGCTAAARILEAMGPQSVCVIGGEPHVAYDRPQLSKSTLIAPEAQDIPLMPEAERLAAAGVKLMLGKTIVAIDRAEHLVVTSDGERVHYLRHLLVASGTRARALDVPGAELEGVHVLRTWKDATALRLTLSKASSVVVIGAGFIGLECAASARRLGLNVTVVEATDRVLARAMPGIVSATVKDKFRSEGVDFCFESQVTHFVGHDHRVRAVVLADGQHLLADAVIIGIGIVPEVEFLSGSGITVENGVVVDVEGRSSDPAILAAGDVSNRMTHFAGRSFRARLEAWEPAREQGAAAAEVMLGHDMPTLRAPWMWSDLFDWNLQSAGYGHLADQEVLRGDRAAGRFTLFQLARRRLVGVVTLNAGRDMVIARRALDQEIEVVAERLADLSIPLKDALAPVPAIGGGAIAV